MGRWNIQISAETYYPEVEAETQEEAILKALDWFIEYEPDIICEEVEEEEPMVIFDPVPSSPEGQFRIGKEWQ